MIILTKDVPKSTLKFLYHICSQLQMPYWQTPLVIALQSKRPCHCCDVLRGHAHGMSAILLTHTRCNVSPGDLKTIISITMHLLNGPLTRYVMHPECRERFSRHRLKRKPLVSDPGMHHGTCVTHVPWCMSGSLTSCGGENVPGITGACATRNFTYLTRGPFITMVYILQLSCSTPLCIAWPFDYARHTKISAL